MMFKYTRQQLLELKNSPLVSLPIELKDGLLIRRVKNEQEEQEESQKRNIKHNEDNNKKNGYKKLKDAQKKNVNSSSQDPEWLTFESNTPQSNVFANKGDGMDDLQRFKAEMKQKEQQESVELEGIQPFNGSNHAEEPHVSNVHNNMDDLFTGLSIVTKESIIQENHDSKKSRFQRFFEDVPRNVPMDIPAEIVPLYPHPPAIDPKNSNTSDNNSTIEEKQQFTRVLAMLQRSSQQAPPPSGIPLGMPSGIPLGIPQAISQAISSPGIPPYPPPPQFQMNLPQVQYQTDARMMPSPQNVQKQPFTPTYNANHSSSSKDTSMQLAAMIQNNIKAKKTRLSPQNGMEFLMNSTNVSSGVAPLPMNGPVYPQTYPTPPNPNNFMNYPPPLNPSLASTPLNPTLNNNTLHAAMMNPSFLSNKPT